MANGAPLPMRPISAPASTDGRGEFGAWRPFFDPAGAATSSLALLSRTSPVELNSSVCPCADGQTGVHPAGLAD